MEMGTGGSRGKRWNGEFRIGAALLSLYALALLLADPERAMWAGAMSAGALPPEIPPSLSHTSADLFTGAGTFSALGLGAFGALTYACETFHGIGFHNAVMYFQKGRRCVRWKEST